MNLTNESHKCPTWTHNPIYNDILEQENSSKVKNIKTIVASWKVGELTRSHLRELSGGLKLFRYGTCGLRCHVTTFNGIDSSHKRNSESS